MKTAVVLFTRDLRTHDNPTLWHAVHDSDRVVPLFVLDEVLLASDYNRPNRAAFLAQALADLDRSLRGRGAGLVVRRGPVPATLAHVVRQVGADVVHVSGDASGYGQRRLGRLREALSAAQCELVVHEDTHFVLAPGVLVPSGGGDHMAVFAAYYKRWAAHDFRPVLEAPASIMMPRISAGTLPDARDICAAAASPDLPRGGETAGRERLSAWLRTDAPRYAELHDDLAADGTSRLSPYLHFGCLSPLDVVSRAGRAAAHPDFVRQVCWRDFHAQVLAARPLSTRRDYRPRGDRWRDCPPDLDAWREGRTGLPLVDAGMRQLRREGWMHNRARLVVAHILTKTLYLDWRLGAQHFVDLLVDGDVANNTMNWQWVAGTGVDSRFNRTYNVDTQAKKYDPTGDYVRRYVDELAGVAGAAVHRPWLLPAAELEQLDYPAPIVDVAAGNRRFLAARGKDR